MSITFAVTVSAIILFLFIIGCIWFYDFDGLAIFTFGLGCLWSFIGLFVIGNSEVSSSYPTTQTNVKIVQKFVAPNKTIRVFFENKQEMVFTKLQDAYLVDAKEAVFITGRKNLWGTALGDVFDDDATRKLNNQ